MKFKLRAFNFSISFLSTYLLLTFSVIENSLMPLIFQIFGIDIVFKLVLATFVSIVFLILNEINHKISTNNEYIHLFGMDAQHWRISVFDIICNVVDSEK